MTRTFSFPDGTRLVLGTATLEVELPPDVAKRITGGLFPGPYRALLLRTTCGPFTLRRVKLTVSGTSLLLTLPDGRRLAFPFSPDAVDDAVDFAGEAARRTALRRLHAAGEGTGQSRPPMLAALAAGAWLIFRGTGRE